MGSRVGTRRQPPPPPTNIARSLSSGSIQGGMHTRSKCNINKNPKVPKHEKQKQANATACSNVRFILTQSLTEKMKYYNL